MRIAVILVLLSGVAFGQLPDAPKVADKSFWAVTAFSGAATAADAYTTANFGPRCPYESGNPGLYGVYPTAKRVTLVMGGLFAASAGASYVLKRHHARLWKVPLWPAPELYLAYGHAAGAASNARNCY